MGLSCLSVTTIKFEMTISGYYRALIKREPDPMSRNYRIMLPALVLLASISCAGQSLAGTATEFFWFPELNSTFRFGLDGPVLDKDDYHAGIDLFLTHESGDFRLLAEYLLSSEEQELERFQFGWLNGKHMFWLGRFHNPLGSWNSQFHHGSFLQTSISRPSIVEFEDDGGILPVHQAGLLVEGNFNFGKRAAGYSLALASGPELDNGLEPWDVLDPGSVSGDTSATLKLHVETGSEVPGRIGVFFGYNEIPASHELFSDIRQKIAGLYGDWEFSRWQLRGASFFLSNELTLTDSTASNSLFSFYVQAELALNDRWTTYGRVEQTSGESGDLYLSLFPEFINDRVLAGFRFDVGSRNALKLELSANRAGSESYSQVELQWSAQF